MARAIYSKAVYKRKAQLDRAVYTDHPRNVIPTGVKVVAATASGTMADYAENETITLLAGTGETAAVLTISAVEDGAITELTVTTPGFYEQDIAGEVDTYTYSGSGTGAVITVVTEAA